MNLFKIRNLILSLILLPLGGFLAEVTPIINNESTSYESASPKVDNYNGVDPSKHDFTENMSKEFIWNHPYTMYWWYPDIFGEEGYEFGDLDWDYYVWDGFYGPSQHGSVYGVEVFDPAFVRINSDLEQQERINNFQTAIKYYNKELTTQDIYNQFNYQFYIGDENDDKYFHSYTDYFFYLSSQDGDLEKTGLTPLTQDEAIEYYIENIVPDYWMDPVDYHGESRLNFFLGIAPIPESKFTGYMAVNLGSALAWDNRFFHNDKIMKVDYPISSFEQFVLEEIHSVFKQDPENYTLSLVQALEGMFNSWIGSQDDFFILGIPDINPIFVTDQHKYSQETLDKYGKISVTDAFGNDISNTAKAPKSGFSMVVEPGPGNPGFATTEPMYFSFRYGDNWTEPPGHHRPVLEPGDDTNDQLYWWVWMIIILIPISIIIGVLYLILTKSKKK